MNTSEVTFHYDEFTSCCTISNHGPHPVMLMVAPTMDEVVKIDPGKVFRIPTTPEAAGKLLCRVVFPDSPPTSPPPTPASS